jgi:hypothetical protein
LPTPDVLSTYKACKCSIPTENVRRGEPLAYRDAFGHYRAKLEVEPFVFVDVNTKKWYNALDSHSDKLTPQEERPDLNLQRHISVRITVEKLDNTNALGDYSILHALMGFRLSHIVGF